MSPAATVTLLLNAYSIRLYEPNCDPGGYVFDAVVEATNETDAIEIALSQATSQFPDGDFELHSIEPA
jgi:hypothetical protein